MSWSRPTERRAAPAALVVVVALLAATHANAAPCDHFAWSLDVERDWLAAGSVEHVASGSKVPAIPNAALELALGKAQKVAYVLPPEHPMRAKGTLGGIYVFEVAKPGLYQLTLSRAAWVDVVQDGKRLPMAEETGDSECPTVSKSLRFRIATGPMVLQLSDSDAKAIRLVVRAVE
jgi:hypothetical protein